MDPLLLSIPAAAKMIGCSKATFYKLINKGDVRAVKLGYRTLVPAEALREYVSNLERIASYRGATFESG